MEIKYSAQASLYNLQLVLILFFIGTIAPLCAQESHSTHRFAWTGGDNALRYEVIFEQIKDGSNTAYLREFTTDHFIDVSLPVGSYRFCVIPYDFLNKPSVPSEWRYIEVIPLPGFEPEQEADPEPLKPFLFNIGIAWSPLIPIYAQNQFEGISFVSAAARLGAVFLLPSNIYMGLELKSVFDLIDGQFFITAGAGLLALKWTENEKIAFVCRFGASYQILPLEDGDYSNNFMPDFGVSLRLRMNNRLLLESGFDFLHIFRDISAGYMRPWVSFGAQF